MDIAKRLRRKFILTAMASVATVLALIVAGVNVVNYLNVIERAEARLDLIEGGGGEMGAGDPAQSPPGQSRPHGISAETPFDTRFFTVTIDAAGDIIAANMNSIAAVDRQQAERMASEVWGSGSERGFSAAYRYRSIVLDPAGGEETRMLVFLDCTRELGQFGSFFRASIAISGLGLLLVCALVAGLSGVAIKPISESYDKQRRFVTDASHELKTPLSVIDANTEVIEMNGGESEWTRGIHDQVSRMAQLADRLVFLARMDEGGGLELAECDLSELARRTVEPYHTVALADGKRLSASIEPHLSCRCDATALAQAVCLLLDNAMRYASKGSVVEVSVRAQGHIRRIEVSNTCDELPQGDLDKLFERFYRSDDSRTRETGGSGIGLSVVRAVAEAHRGHANCTTSGSDTITFCIAIHA